MIRTILLLTSLTAFGEVIEVEDLPDIKVEEVKPLVAVKEVPQALLPEKHFEEGCFESKRTVTEYDTFKFVRIDYLCPPSK